MIVITRLDLPPKCSLVRVSYIGNSISPRSRGGSRGLVNLVKSLTEVRRFIFVTPSAASQRLVSKAPLFLHLAPRSARRVRLEAYNNVVRTIRRDISRFETHLPRNSKE